MSVATASDKLDQMEELAAACEKAASGSVKEVLAIMSANDALARTAVITHSTYIRCQRFLTAGAYLEAAMTLVPEGMGWFRERGAYVPFIVSVDGPTCRYVSECDSGLALALCAAAVRAQIAKARGDQ